MLPDGWLNTDLGAVTEIVTSGSRNWAQYYSDSGSRFIRMTNLSRDGIHLKLDDMKYVDVKSDSSDGKRTSLQFGDILISITAELGKIGWVPDGFGEAYINQHTALVRLNKIKVSSKYIAYLLASTRMNKIINRLNDSGAKSGLNLSTIAKIPVNIAPLPEQKKIAKILSTWDKAITTTEQLMANSQQQKKALMQQLLTGKKRLAGFSGEWEEVSVSQFGKVITGNTPPKADNSNYGDSVCWATAPDFKGKYIQATGVMLSIKGSKKARVLPVGSVLVTCIASIGKNAIASVDMATNQQINSVIVSENHSNEFFFYIIGYYKQKLIAWAGTTAVPILNKSSFEKIKFLAPIKQEQQKIAQVLSSADQEIETLQQKLNFLKEEKKALMQQLLTGKRRVKV